jgi:hypothetical protein
LSCAIGSIVSIIRCFLHVTGTPDRALFSNHDRTKFDAQVNPQLRTHTSTEELVPLTVPRLELVDRFQLNAWLLP